jgi:hypothetical protein
VLCFLLPRSQLRVFLHASQINSPARLRCGPHRTPPSCPPSWGMRDCVIAHLLDISVTSQQLPRVARVYAFWHPGRLVLHDAPSGIVLFAAIFNSRRRAATLDCSGVDPHPASPPPSGAYTKFFSALLGARSRPDSFGLGVASLTV